MNKHIIVKRLKREHNNPQCICGAVDLIHAQRHSSFSRLLATEIACYLMIRSDKSHGAFACPCQCNWLLVLAAVDDGSCVTSHATMMGTE